MGAGQGLDPVQPAFPAPRGGTGVVGDDLRDVVLVHLARERPVRGLAHGRRPDGRQPGSGVGLAAAANVRDLAHQASAVGVHSPREPPEVLDDVLVVQVPHDVLQSHGIGPNIGSRSRRGSTRWRPNAPGSTAS